MKYKLLKYFSAFLCCLSHKNLLRLGHILGILYFHLIAKERNRAVDRMMKSFKIDEEKAKKNCQRFIYQFKSKCLGNFIYAKIKKR